MQVGGIRGSHAQILRGAVALLWLVAALGTARPARAEGDCDAAPAVEVTITCSDWSCRADRAPSPGTVVRIAKLDAPPGTLIVLVGRRSWWIMPVGSRICSWPGLDGLRIRPPDRAKVEDRGVRVAYGIEVTQRVRVHMGSPVLPTQLRFEPDAPSVNLGVGVGYATEVESSVGDHFVDLVAIDTKLGAICTGIVIGPHQVLTAAHCGDAAGVTLAGTRHAVKSLHRAPGGADAAVLLTEESLAVTARRRSRRGDDAPLDGRIHIVGYGAEDDRGERGVGTLREGDTAVIGWECTGRRISRFGCVPGLEVVVASPGVDSCRGDSGGPIFDFADGGWRLIGITSRRLPTARSVCGSGGIYTHVGALAAWLDQELGVP